MSFMKLLILLYIYNFLVDSHFLWFSLWQTTRHQPCAVLCLGVESRWTGEGFQILYPSPCWNLKFPSPGEIWAAVRRLVLLGRAEKHNVSVGSQQLLCCVPWAGSNPATELEVTNKEVTNKEVTNKEVTNKEVTNKEVTNKEVTNKVLTRILSLVCCLDWWQI